MSVKGQILRGEKWYLMNRDADGNLNEAIKKDTAKMVEIDMYLAARDPAPEAKKEEAQEETKSKKKK